MSAARSSLSRAVDLSPRECDLRRVTNSEPGGRHRGLAHGHAESAALPCHGAAGERRGIQRPRYPELLQPAEDGDVLTGDVDYGKALLRRRIEVLDLAAEPDLVWHGGKGATCSGTAAYRGLRYLALPSPGRCPMWLWPTTDTRSRFGATKRSSRRCDRADVVG